MVIIKSISGFARNTLDCLNFVIKKYATKGEKSCGNKYVDDGVLYRAFISTYNIVIDNLDYFMGKWKGQVDGQDILSKVIAKRFIATFQTARHIEQFDLDLYFKLVEKITVSDARLVVSLLDGSGVECEIE